MIFMATPHSGSKHADLGSLLSNVARIAFQRPAKQLIETLRKDSPGLQRLTDEFKILFPKINIASFYERRKAPLLGALVGLRNFLFYTKQVSLC